MQGWIKLHRQLIEWEWYQDTNVKVLFIHLLLLANHTEKRWRGFVIKRGQLITSNGHLAKELGFSIQQIRTALNKLKSTQEITIKSTNKNKLITIENYDKFQCEDENDNNQNNNQITGKQQSNNNQITTTKNDKNEKNEKNDKNIVIEKNKPTIEEIRQYIEEKNYNIDAEYFFNYYEANGWKVGKNKMKSWKATLGTWNRKSEMERKNNKPVYLNYEQRTYHDLDKFYTNIEKE
jgi:hypothetical protein